MGSLRHNELIDFFLDMQGEYYFQSQFLDWTPVPFVIISILLFVS